MEVFEKFIELYKVDNFDTNTLICTKIGVQLKHSIRPLKDHEISSNIVDLAEQTCSCEAFTRRHQQGLCKHVLALNFAQQNDLLTTFVQMSKDIYEL